MNDETMELVKRHREAAGMQAYFYCSFLWICVVVVGVVVFKIVGVTCS